MTRARFAALVMVFVAVLAARTDGRRAGDQAPQDPSARLGATLAPVIDALWNGYDRDAAIGHVQFIAKNWRLPGNPSYNASIDRIKARLEAAGLAPTVEEYPGSGPAWDHTVGTLALVTPGKSDELVISRQRDEKDHIALCINSFSTAPEGVVAPLIDVGAGAAQDFAGKDVKGAVVLGNAAPNQLWNRAVTMGGAIGIVSASPPASYITPDAPGAAVTPREQWDIFQWAGVPYDAARKAFGFKASARAAAALRKRLAEAGSTPVSVHVTIVSTFDTGPVRTLSVEITGRTLPAERIVMAAHVQEPGANDNASGVATLAETVVSLAMAIKQQKVAQPERTLTFLFLNEISGSRRWLQDHAEAAKQVRYMFSLDMTGEDVKKTGGTFLIERYPDPGAVWTRPWDPHTEWGGGNMRADSLKGDLLNDEHMFVVQQVAKRTGWVAKSNPYEGGSDHTVFQGAGVPSVLNWHFTDRYYHSNFDTPDKTSPDEMRNVGVSVGASAWLLASATPAVATNVAEVVAKAGRDRIAVETTEGGKLAAASTDAGAATRQATIVAAWKKWYAEAVRSASRLVVGTAPASFGDDLNRIAAAFEGSAAIGGGPGKFGFVAAPVLSAIAAPSQFQSIERSGAMFVCGEDQRLPRAIPLTWTAIVLAGDGRMFVPCPAQALHSADHREFRESAVIARGLLSEDPTIRWRAAQATARLPLGPNMVGELRATSFVRPVCDPKVQIVGGLENPRRWQPGQLFRLLADQNVSVRKEAAYALGVRLADAKMDAELVVAAGVELRACLLLEKQPEVQGLILEAIGVAHYGNDDARTDAEVYITDQSNLLPSTDNQFKVLGVAKGLEALFRQNPRRQVTSATLVRLRQLVTFGSRLADPPIEDIDARVRRLALMALQTVGDWDNPTVAQAVNDSDWQLRRILAGRVNLSDPNQAPIAAQLENDLAFQVRYDLLTPQSRLAARTGLCAPIIARFKDPSPAVAMRAMDLIPATCTDLDEAITMLTDLADTLSRSESFVEWHLPSRALSALARLKPPLAAPRLEGAIVHPAWQVRAAAAATCVTLNHVGYARKLADDREANVRTAALDAMFRMKDEAIVRKAIEAIKTTDDHQLLRMAALVLKGQVRAEDQEEASVAFLGALRRLTAKEADTSRDARVAMIDRLAEIIPGNLKPDLQPYTIDFDDEVSAAAKKAYSPPAEMPQRRRYPFQPSEAALTSLPTQATITLKDGVVTLRLLPEVAPVTIARFAALANQRYYHDRIFHRIVTNFVVQGGSPGANEYMGTNRYMRDEVGPQASHIRGAVGISTRGGDTGDAQLFIDLVDVPRLDRDYTVFAYVTQGMEFIDRMLDGAKIFSISVK
jgi:aminopeptidase YwaD